MPRKPAGVIVAAIVLLLLSVLQLLGAGFWVMAAIAFRNNPDLAVSGPGAGAASGGLIVGMIAFFALICLVLAAWGILTSIGLFRIKNWARISIAIMGGILGVLGLLGAALSAIVPGLIKARGVPIPPPTTPQLLNAMFYGAALLMLAVAAVGLWWLIYFLLRSTREVFLGLPAVPAATYPYAPSMTDFTIAQPLPPAPPVEPAPQPPANPGAPQP